MKIARINVLSHRGVLAATAGLLLLWVGLHVDALTATQNGGIRFFLTALFSLMILLRHKPPSTGTAPAPPGGAAGIVAAALSGTLLLLGGLIFNVNQAEWLGLLLVAFAGLKWALPPRFGRDLVLALFLLYWAHPLPAQVFGPFQLAMQRWSVQGSEWLLHLFNVRVWADGLVLHTELTTCEVPAWCSGMRTATTVFLLSLGLAILHRFRWVGGLLFAAAAVLQALALNILRIAAVVVLTPRFAHLTSDKALHDSMSVIVILGAFVVYGELRLVQGVRRRRARRETEPHYEHDRLITEHPPFWKSLIHHRALLVAGVALLLLGAAVAYKSRPYHRMRMIGDLAIDLMHAERYDEAERALAVVRAYWPDDDEWKLARIRVLLARRKYDEVLEAIETLPTTSPARAAQKEVLRAYSLMGLGRLEDAAALVNALPEETRRNDPRAGMILAEMAFRADEPDDVAEHVVTASRWQPNAPRIRMLYPYLRTYRKWNAISRSDIKQPFADAGQALSAIEAYMNLNQAPLVADMTLRAMQKWPADPRILEPLFFLAVQHTDPKWEQYFGSHLRRAAAGIQDPALLYPLFDRCFALQRPDLAWFLFRHIRDLTPDHPILPLVAARYGNQWFVFRRRFLGLSAGRPTDTIDIGALALARESLAGAKSWTTQIPLRRELLHGEPTQVRKTFLREAIRRFAQRAEREPLGIPMHYEYVWALEVSGDIDAAREALDRLVARYPAEADAARVRLSEIYANVADWEQVYETLRGYLGSRTPALEALLRLCEAERKLRLGLRALHTARETERRFPESTRAASMLADTLRAYDAEADALLVLSRPRRWHDRAIDILTAQLLQDTQRFRAAETLRKAAMLPRTLLGPRTEQQMFLPPAELTLLWHRLSIPSDDEFRKQAEGIERNLQTTQSAFLTAMLSLWMEQYTQGCRATPDEQRRWEECGRDRFEKATALNQYTLLLYHQDHAEAARRAAEAAAKHFPEAPTLWRLLISLSRGDPAVIAHARTACPDDSDLWLAELVARTRSDSAGDPAREARNAPAENPGWSEAHVLERLEEAVASRPPRFTTEALVRGGEVLFRIGMTRAAAVLARDAFDRARSLLPAYVLAVKCALIEKDKPWALAATQGAIDASLDPPLLFFRKLVELRTEGRQIPVDSEIIEALRNLRRQEPENPLWAELLGYVRFKRGGWEVVEALAEMTHAIEKGARGKTTYIIAAECARLLGNFERAEELLRRGLARYPDDVAMRNNLAFVLAFRPDGLDEAEAIAQALSSEVPDDPEIMDTLAVISIRAGRYAVAENIIHNILDLAEERTPLWFRARTHQADIALQQGDPRQAIDILNELLSRAEGIEDADVMKANDLFVKARMQRNRLAAERTPSTPTNRPDNASVKIPSETAE